VEGFVLVLMRPSDGSRVLKSARGLDALHDARAQFKAAPPSASWFRHLGAQTGIGRAHAPLSPSDEGRAGMSGFRGPSVFYATARSVNPQERVEIVLTILRRGVANQIDAFNFSATYARFFLCSGCAVNQKSRPNWLRKPVTQERKTLMMNPLNPTIQLPRLTKAKGLMLTALLAGAMTLPILVPVHEAQADNGDFGRDGNSDALLGTWLVQVSLDPATVPPGTALNFTEIDTYGAGGGFVESNSGPAAGGPPGQGNWVRTGHREFALTQLRLGFDAANHYTGINKIRASLTLNKSGDEFTANSQVDIFLPDGTLLPIHPAATAHGTRVPIEPLN
jgi:hypothetical protein